MNKSSMRRLPAVMVFGNLEGEQKVALGMVENKMEYDELKAEYREVFGEANISFTFREISKKDYAKAKAEAWANVFKSLNGPITNVLTSITQKRK